MRARQFARPLVWLPLAVLAVSAGCAHRREAYYPRQPGGVHVRAPFVNVQVPGPGRRVEVDARRNHLEPPLDMDRDAWADAED
jgi:hypothetical protein